MLLLLLLLHRRLLLLLLMLLMLLLLLLLLVMGVGLLFALQASLQLVNALVHRPQLRLPLLQCLALHVQPCILLQ